MSIEIHQTQIASGKHKNEETVQMQIGIANEVDKNGRSFAEKVFDKASKSNKGNPDVRYYFDDQDVQEERECYPIHIKYFDKNGRKITPLACWDNGDWIDLRSAEDVTLHKGEFYLLSLGVAMKLPRGFEANIVPRSSTFKNWHIIQTNSFAVIDNSYCGDNDEWKYPIYATEDTTIHFDDRICQFRINRKQPSIKFYEVNHLENKDRGGFGSSGKN